MISSAIIRPIFPAPALVPPGIPGTVGWVLFGPPATKESESEKENNRGRNAIVCYIKTSSSHDPFEVQP